MRSAVLALPKASSRRVVSSSASSRACLLAHAVIFAIPHDIVFFDTRLKKKCSKYLCNILFGLVYKKNGGVFDLKSL